MCDMKIQQTINGYAIFSKYRNLNSHANRIVYFVFLCVVFILRTRPAFIKQQQRENGQLVVSYVDA